MTPRSLPVVIAAILVCSTIYGCSDSGSERVKFATGPQGGSWYPLGGAIKNLIENNVEGTRVQNLPGAGIANVKAVESGQAQIALANSVSTVDGINGRPPFTEKVTNVCNVATLYPQFFQVVTLPEAGIRDPGDLKGKALAGQQKGNTGEAITDHMLQAYGLGFDDLSRVSYGSYTDSVTLMKDGNAEVFTLGTTIPAGAVMDLASARTIKLMPIPNEGLKRMQEFNPGYRRGIIPKGTYPKQTQDVPTVEYATHFIVRCELEDQFVYDMLDSIHSGLADLAAIAKAIENTTAETMGKDIGVPMHPGAARWYQEKGIS
ncbi:MAG: TAXI family TRAP transporter solute-binding subunit [Betaproteobacteria bacterium]|nr:MAG: TAXI family TRAP transporter solute-binding subunit [Betaproteobacteria bacterium]